MTPEQYESLPPFIARKRLCDAAGVSQNSIRMRKLGLPTEEECKAISKAMLPLIHRESVLPLLDAAQRVLDAWEGGNLSETVNGLEGELNAFIEGRTM